MEFNFDVFFSYNTKDQESVMHLAGELRSLGIEVWLDDWMIQPGTPLVKSIDKGITASRAIAVFIGANNFGPWQDPEVEIAISEQIKRDIPVIPVLLPGTTDEVFEQLPRFLKRNRCVDFRSGLHSKKAMNYLIFGITGKSPEPDEAPAKPAALATPPPDQEPNDEAIDDLVQLLKTQNVTFFLGPGAAYGSDPMPAQASDIARYLLSELKIIETTYDQLLPPVDVAGLYYAIKSGDRVLESRVTNRMAQSSRVFPHTHERLASLLKLLPQRPARRSGGRGPQLIVTTNLDLMMERALLRAGLSFMRIVQHRSGQQVIINHYDNVRLVGSDTVQLPPEPGDVEPVQAGLDNFDELDHIIRTYGKRSLTLNQGGAYGDPTTAPEVLNLNKVTQPILYKFLGSQDIGNSCVLSTSHHFEFARNTLQHNCIPESLMSNIRNSTILFLGLWFMDPDFRLTYYTLLRDALHMENDRRYALQLPPQRFTEDIYRKMEAGLWEKIKEAGTRQMGITTIEEPCDIFLNKVYEKAQAEFRTDS